MLIDDGGPTDHPAKLIAPRRRRRRTPKRTCISKFQRHVAGLFRQVLGDSYMRYELNWSWLKNEDGNDLYLDIYFPSYSLAIEAHGAQHYTYPNFYHKTYPDYERQRSNDRTKRRLLKEHGIKYIAVRETPKPKLEDVVKLLKSIGIVPGVPPLVQVNNTMFTDGPQRRNKRK